MSQVLVIGAHGKVALLAEKQLVEAGHQVTGAVRNPDHADDVRATGAEPVVADVTTLDPDGLTTLIGEHDLVVWSAGAGGGSPERTYAVDRDAAIRTADAAAAGGTHLVMVSYFGAGPDHGVDPDDAFYAYADAKSAADAHIEASSAPWTILRPSALTDEPAGVGIATTDTEPSEVSRATVAAVITAVADAPDAAAGRVITFNDGDEEVAGVVAGG